MITMNTLFKKKNQIQYNPTVQKDCTECVLQPNIGNNNCLRCICDEISINKGCEKIIIKAGVLMELSDDCIPLMNDISRSFCGHSFGMNNRRCSDCPLGQSLNDELWNDFTEENISEMMERLKLTYIDCGNCEECASHAYEIFSQMREDYVALSKDAHHLANRIVRA